MGQTERGTYELMARKPDSQMNIQADGQKDRKKDGPKDRRTEGPKDRETDRNDFRGFVEQGYKVGIMKTIIKWKQSWN